MTLPRYEIPEFDTALGARLREASRNMQREAVALMTRAVTEWSAQAGMTPERWLDFYEPKLDVKPSGDGQLTMTVTAKLREDGENFTVAL